MANKLNANDEDRVVAAWHECYTVRGTADRTGVSREAVKRVLRDKGFERSNGPGAHAKLTVTDRFFDTVTRESAYYLGLAICDGYITRRQNGGSTSFGFGLKAEDVGLVARFRDKLCPGAAIVHDRHLRKFTVGDAPTCLDIAQWGVRWRDKTHEKGPCRDLFDAAEEKGLVWHLIRGIFDADGSVGVYGKRGSNTALSFHGTGRFLTELRARIDRGGSLRKGEKGTGDSGYTLKYTGMPVVIELGTKLYHHKGDDYLPRKFEAFSGVVKARELLETSA